ncbi:ubiquitin carboxyl-terminal hydrolase CYLD [Erpetoichthys calabaricus]|uniref:ubiquitinyl hydrolase 1 n=1 Tax=Erpetoichthys calabaricus TaxID=27687 RepID=A0A8C4SC13_ERPCA|nr:ubiquitin carboxyl-terminal hydrolase CYLD [Erpetoichthys calabaricus]
MKNMEVKIYFIVTNTAKNKTRFNKGTIGVVQNEVGEEYKATILESATYKKDQNLKKVNVNLISKREAQILLGIENLEIRIAVFSSKIFRTICTIHQNDLVVVKQKNGEVPGLVVDVLEQIRKTSSSQLLNGIVFDVELLKEQGNVRVIISAEKIISVSSDNNPQVQDHKEAQKFKEIPRQNSIKKNEQNPEKSSTPSVCNTVLENSSMILKQDGLLEAGSMVELQARNGATIYGVVRWIGIPPGKSELWAGVELDYELKNCTDGLFENQRYFSCDDNKGMFVKLQECRPDSRFFAASTSQLEPPCVDHYSVVHVMNKAELQNNEADVPPIPESEVIELLEGKMKGIQGHYNSCYLDTALFSLFCFSDVLDSVLHCPNVGEQRIQTVLRKDIVNQLRRRGFVPAENVMKLRNLLGCSTFASEEKDPEEFLSVLLHQVLAVEPLLKIRSNDKTQDCYSYQIIMEKEDLEIPSVQTLLERSFLSCDLKFDEIPSCLIIQMPRFGKGFKLFPRIVPSTELDITDLLHNSPRECFLCGSVAEIECLQCLQDPKLMPGVIKQFCQKCDKQVHSHKKRQHHHPQKIFFPLMNDFSSSAVICRHKLELFAVLCIKTSHYVSFVKYGPGKNSWLFFDSMADRCGGENGYNIPEIKACPEVGEFLSKPAGSIGKSDLEKADGFVERLLCDSYMFMYKCPALCLYR